MLLVTVVAILVSLETAKAATLFTVLEGPWTNCTAINSTQACYRTRDVACVKQTTSSENLTAPWYYCNSPRLPTVELCDEGTCLQDCVVTEWTPWTPCSCAQSFYRTRTRSVVTPPRNGGASCPSLLERETCNNCFFSTFETLPRTYTWKTGTWGSCQALDSVTGCGSGLQRRTLQCFSFDGSQVPNENCDNELAYSYLVAPSASRLCSVPCECEVGPWSEWGPCLPHCKTTSPNFTQSRTRAITLQATNGGSCPDLTESRPCEDQPPTDCPSYSWSSSEWSTCKYLGEDECGTGFHTRFIYCIKELNGTFQNTELSDCELLASNPKPSSISGCNKECPRSCVLSEWSAWSECAPSCSQTFSNRSREVLVQPYGGESCPHTIELRECPEVPCVQWIAGEYSDCFVSPQDCGSGTQSRTISCGDELGNEIAYHRCLGLPMLPTTLDCHIPCPFDCVVSDWTPWTECSHSCGESNGFQQRYRHLIAVGDTCIYGDDDFAQNRSCTLPQPCDPEPYHVTAGPWSECSERPISSGDMPNSIVQSDGFLSRPCIKGIRNRTLFCIQNGLVVENCPIEFQPTEDESCDLSCDQECVFSDWSDFAECSVSCGIGTRSRTRHLIQFPDNPERECQVDSRGLQTETMECTESECTTTEYQWSPNSLSDCILFDGLDCGLGYRDARLDCIQFPDGSVVNNTYCSSLPRPNTAVSCSIACPAKCILTEWSEYSMCLDGEQNRTRDIISSSGVWTESCPQLVGLELVQFSPCYEVDLSIYDYSPTSTYSSTVIDDPAAVCGNGNDYRTISCIDMSTFKPQDEEFCIGRDKQPSKEESSIRCDIDCQQSDWGEWSPCSTTCGYGVRNRERTIQKQPQTSGRECGPAVEYDICYIGPCPHVEYTPGEYSTCVVANQSSVCGEGTRSREALCLLNSVVQDTTIACVENGALIGFDLTETCRMPCPGECVVSNWGPWSECGPASCPEGGCQRSRTRIELREGLETEECMETQEFELCERQVEDYNWVIREWGNCTVKPSNLTTYCGPGIRHAVIECINTDTRDTVHDSLCTTSKPSDVQSCTIPCPIDCVVGVFSEWTECPQICELELEQMRHRSIIVPELHGGRLCPEMTQYRSCPPANCTVYVIEAGRSACEFELSGETQCGAPEETKALNCRRNAQFVDMSVCLEAIDQGLNVVGSELLAEGSCDAVDCPVEPVCVYTDWSDWSGCVSLCIDESSRFNYRTRALIRSHDNALQHCERMQYEVSECEVLESENGSALAPFNITDCIGFEWSASDFINEMRNVDCVTSSGTRVANGCPPQIRPSDTQQSCDPDKCPLYSSCDQNACSCQADYEPTSRGECLPLSGCGDSTHCLYPHMTCSSGQCVCKENFVNENGICSYIGPPTTLPPPTNPDGSQAPVTGPTHTPHSPHVTGDTSTTGSGNEVELDILPIALIATVPLVIIIIITVIVIIVLWRCRRETEKASYEVSLRDRVKISAPSPVHSLDRYGKQTRGADSASSGFVDDVEHEQFRYGMAGRTFLGSNRMMPSSREDIDEAAFTAEFPAQAPPTPSIHPVPVAVPSLPGYQLEHIALDYRPHADLPDGDFTTDLYTTDDGSLMTTSVPPSSAGSPNIARRHLQQVVEQSLPNEGGYVPMHPIYSQVTPKSQRSQTSHDTSHDRSHDMSQDGSHDRSHAMSHNGSYDRSHDWQSRSQEHHPDWEVRSDPRGRIASEGSRDYRSRSHDARDRLHSNSSYDYRQYREQHTPERHRSRSAGRSDNYRIYEQQRERYYNRRDHRSPSPHDHHSRQRGIATGLDNSLIQAVSQFSNHGGSITPAHSIRSSGSRGSRGSHRRRRKRYHGQPQHIVQSYRQPYHSDGPTDHEMTSASEAEQYHDRMPSRSVPISPVHPDPNEPDYDTLPPPPPMHIHVTPNTPPSRRGGSPSRGNSPTRTGVSPDHSRVGQLRGARPVQGHYDYPKYYYQSQPGPSPQESSASPQPSPLTNNVTPPTPPLPPPPPMDTPTRSTAYEHLSPLKLLPAETSPLMSRRHPPSPLARQAYTFDQH